MKKWMGALMVLGFVGCNEPAAKKQQPVSTVDSNIMEQPEAGQPVLDIDSPRGDTSFSIAMDSAAPAILPEDTNYHRR